MTWRRNGSMISNVVRVFFIGGGETIINTGPCESQMYRVALQLNGYLPGSYEYTVDNADTADPGVTSSTVLIQGIHLNLSALCIYSISQ